MLVSDNGQLRSVSLVDNPALYQALVMMKDSDAKAHEREYLILELNRALAELRGTAQWLESELRRMDELRGSK